jgi:hypothetical protein
LVLVSKISQTGYRALYLKDFQMKHIAIEKANSRLRVAQKALTDLKSCRTFEEFSDAWYVVLTSSKNIYTVLEQGAKGAAQSMQWLGAKKQIRKNDTLLQYMFEARNDDEHGLGSSVALKPELHEIGVAGPGFSSTIRLDGGPFSNVVISGCQTAVAFSGGPPPLGLRVTPLDGKPVQVRRSPATTILVPVIARGDRKYDPPTHHLGHKLNDTSPIAVAELNVAYLAGLLNEASGLA